MANSSHSRLDTQNPKLRFLDSLENGGLAEWLSSYGKYVLYGLIGLIGLMLIIYRFSSSQTAKAEQDYLQAANDFTLFIRPENKDAAAINEAFKRLNALMNKHSELHAAYGGAIAQTLINRGQLSEAKPFATATLDRTSSDDLPYYAEYASTSLMITEQQNKAALEKAVALQQKMSDAISRIPNPSERSFGEELFALNLLRIGLLQQQLGDSTAELQTWKEWKQYAGLENSKELTVKVNPVAFRTVIQQLAIGSTSLLDYIAFREQVLKR